MGSAGRRVGEPTGSIEPGIDTLIELIGDATDPLEPGPTRTVSQRFVKAARGYARA